jgi:hypothetical protein
LAPEVSRVVVWIAVCVLGCGQGEGQSPQAATEAGAFDAERAFRDLVAQVEIGPRPAGSAGSARARSLISQRLRQAGWRVEEQRFHAQPPGRAPVEMTNLIARLPSSHGETQKLMLITHYDTKLLPEAPGFLGANDGASGTALMLELARHLSRRDRALAYEFVFFDGEEAFGPRITPVDGLYGSRALAQRMREDGSQAEVHALLLVDMLGDADLGISHDARSDPELVDLWTEVARERGALEALAGPLRFIDDHTPLQDIGIHNVLALIDFRYGADWSPGPRWHTEADNLEGVSVESLNTAGSLIVEWLRRVEAAFAAYATRAKSG